MNAHFYMVGLLCVGAVSCEVEPRPEAEAPRPEAVTVESAFDADRPGAARSPLAPPRTPDNPTDAGFTPTCDGLKKSMASDAAACYRLMPDVSACTRMNRNLSKMVSLGCKLPDAGHGPGAPDAGAPADEAHDN